MNLQRHVDTVNSIEGSQLWYWNNQWTEYDDPSIDDDNWWDQLPAIPMVRKLTNLSRYCKADGQVYACTQIKQSDTDI